MAPLGALAEAPALKPLRVLLLGFGSYQSVPGKNPAFEAIRPLDGLYLDARPSVSPDAGIPDFTHRSVLISVYQSPVPVEYGWVMQNIPRIFDIPFDLVIHVGSADYLRIESTASKSGYTRYTDVAGQRAPILPSTSDQQTVIDRGFGKSYEGLPDQLSTTVQTVDLVNRLQACGLPHVVHSDNAGGYLCEYAYYALLAESIKRNKGTAVLFVHVPGATVVQSGGQAVGDIEMDSKYPPSAYSMESCISIAVSVRL